MNITQLLNHLKQSGIKLTVKNKKLLIDSAKGQLTLALKTQILQHKTEILERLRYHGLTKAELKTHATAQEWQDIQHNELVLQTFADAVVSNQLRAQGIVPADYTTTTFCMSCQKTVPIPPSLQNNGIVLGCPWCFTRNLSADMYH